MIGINLLSGNNYEGILLYSIVGATLIRTVLRGYSNSLNLTISIITIFLFAIPAAAIYALLRVNVLPVMFTFIVFSDLLLVLNHKLVSDVRNQPYRLVDGTDWSNSIMLLLLLTWCAFAGIFINAEGFLGLLLFSAPFGVSLVYFDLIVSRYRSQWQTIFALLLYFIVIASYIAFQWSGFGRIVIASLILAPLLIVNARIDLGIRVLYFIIIAPAALFVAQVSRYGAIEDPQNLFIGSAGHHLLVTHDVMNRNDHLYSGGWNVFFEQYALFFLNWFPRNLWTEKPLGIGLWSVDILYGRAGYGEGYSHSIGFLGEQYFYFGELFGFGLIIMILTLVSTRIVLSWLSFGFAAPVILFDISLISYFWGGMATFGSRFWFLTVPTLLACWLLRSRLRHNRQRRSPVPDTLAG